MVRKKYVLLCLISMFMVISLASGVRAVVVYNNFPGDNELASTPIRTDNAKAAVFRVPAGGNDYTLNTIDVRLAIQSSSTSCDIRLSLHASDATSTIGAVIQTFGTQTVDDETPATFSYTPPVAQTVTAGDYYAVVVDSLVCDTAGRWMSSTVDTTEPPTGIFEFVSYQIFTASWVPSNFFNYITIDADPIIIPEIITPVILSPDPFALGCVVTSDIDLAGAPDNTYCRILMQNGGVVNYSGAVPSSLIGLGVKLAVEVYRLEGGQGIMTFPNYTRVCLSGTGRLFYLDGRDAPRSIIELATESLGGATCGWIPAAGTLVLTD